MKRTEEQIKKDVVDQLYWDSRVDASKVKVEVDDGKVTLSGTVPTYSARRNAELDARAIPEVILVDNRIRVEYLANVPPDEEIQSNVETVLGWNPEINARNIHASVDGGWVTLEGTVDNLWHKTRAEELVSDLTGVVGVTDKLSVVPTKNIVDETIGENIVAALDRNVEVDVNTVDVKVEHGSVTLSGTVPTWGARIACYEAALFTDGVIDINDHLVVGV